MTACTPPAIPNTVNLQPAAEKCILPKSHMNKQVRLFSSWEGLLSHDIVDLTRKMDSQQNCDHVWSSTTGHSSVPKCSPSPRAQPLPGPCCPRHLAASAMAMECQAFLVLVQASIVGARLPGFRELLQQCPLQRRADPSKPSFITS